MNSSEENGEDRVEILVVEDSPTQAEQLKHLLEHFGYSVTVAGNGEEALAAARKRAPTLILSDVVMPKMDGYTLCKQIKSDPELRSTPVILGTALSTPQDVIKGLECGADNFITKPYDEPYLRSRIQYLLANRNLREREKTQIGVEIFFTGRKYFITADRLQILNLLLSTYETAVQKNLELAKARDELKELNEHLEKIVEERTAALRTEIAERTEMESALRESEASYRRLFDNANDIIFALDLQGKFISLNPTGEAISGYTLAEVRNLDVSQLLVPKHVETVSRELKDRLASGPHAPNIVMEIEIVASDGRRVPLEVNARIIWENGRPTEVEGIARDTSERRRLQEQFLHAQKMEAIGRLAGGVAHDFNNLLTGIIGYAQLVAGGLDPGSNAVRDLDQIRELGERAAGLTRQLLAFSRRQVLEPVVLNVNDLVEKTTKLLKRVIGEDIDLKFVASPELGNIRADPGQIEQVLMNLAVNARDAMPEGGTLTIETAEVVLDQKDAARHAEVHPGVYVMLAVTDNGCGMDKATMERIFEPFFTTKEEGKGTGLGLSTVYGIVKQHGGHVWVYSEPDQGTTFKIYFPRVGEQIQRPVATAREGTVPRGSETILVVEDEEAVRNLVTRILESHGYIVLPASNPKEAEQIFAQRGAEIALLLTDVVLPKFSGRELYRRLAARQRSLKVLFMSGYTEKAAVHQGVFKPGTSMLQKPFTPATLATKVRQVLDRRRVTKVLVADDEPSVVRALEYFLEKNGYTVVSACNGNEAIEMVAREKPEAAILDILMPGKNGLEVLERIKQINEDVLVIMLTSVEDEEVARNALQMGAADYIIKPFDPEYLETVLCWQ